MQQQQQRQHMQQQNGVSSFGAGQPQYVQPAPASTAMTPERPHTSVLSQQPVAGLSSAPGMANGALPAERQGSEPAQQLGASQQCLLTALAVNSVILRAS